MKTVDPNMKLDRQVRKALDPVDTELLSIIKELAWPDMEERLRKVRYTLNLVNDMVKSSCNGQPRPWSEFSPMIDEEFS